MRVCVCGGLYACVNPKFAKTIPTHTHTNTQATHVHTRMPCEETITDSLLLRAPAARSRVLR